MSRSCRDVTNSSLSANSCKTPSNESQCFGKTNKTPGSAGRRKTPSNKLRNVTPSRNHAAPANRTPGFGGDRYIPNRSASQFELGHFLIFNQSSTCNDSQTGSSVSPTKAEYQRLLSESLNGGRTAPADPNKIDSMNTSSRILAYQKKPPQAPMGYNNSQRIIYSARATPASSCKKSIRHIPSQPERILDAPDILDDYYLNLLDWNSSNVLAVALGGHVYLWNAITGDIQQLLEMEGEEYVSSVSWIREGTFLAVGTSTGEAQLWDVAQSRRLRSMKIQNDSSRVGSLAWNSYILTAGKRSGSIFHNDVRVANHLVGHLAGHTQEVCGLKWSHDGRFLASGGNDNLLHVWPQIPSQFISESTPMYTFTDHQAAVKAVSWCPWQTSILASGGGTADRHIRLWNINTGSSACAVDTSSQVCSILWSSEYKELITGHGFPSHQLIIWKYPKMTKVAELVGHTSRILHMALSPDEQMVVSAAADESLRIWNCFAQDPRGKKSEAVGRSLNNSPAGKFTRSIR